MCIRDRYYYIQDDGAKSCIADLRELAPVTFEKGALVVPMDQEMGTIIGMLMEPDVGDSASYNGTDVYKRQGRRRGGADLR